MSDLLPPPPPEELQAAEGRPDIADVPWTVGDAIVVLLLWVPSIVVFGGLLLLGLQRLLPDMDPTALSLPIASFLLIALTTGYVRARHPGAVPKLIGPRPPSRSALGYGVLAGVAALVVFAFGLGNLLQFIVNAMDNELPQVQEGFREIAADPSAAPLLIVGSILFAPAAEELFYRGMLFTALRRRMAMWPAMGLSAGLWALSHIAGESDLAAGLLILLIIWPLGMLLAWVYERRGSLLTNVVAHATFNCVQVFLLVRTQGGI